MDHGKKIAAVIAVGGFFVLYFVLYALAAFFLPGMPAAGRIVFGAAGALLGAAMIKVIIERIGEIKKGEEDDLSNY